MNRTKKSSVKLPFRKKLDMALSLFCMAEARPDALTR